MPSDKKPWSPERGLNIAYDDTGTCFPGIITCAEARGVDLHLTFDRETPGDEFTDYWAYEHDFKLYNEENWNNDYVCPANQKNDFWADREAGIVWGTTMPDPYLDTNASDNCREHDLSVGSYHRRKFERKSYYVGLIVAPGDHGDSEYKLRSEALDKDCDISPWCVGIKGDDGGREVLVPETSGFAPGCRTWISATNEFTPC